MIAQRELIGEHRPSKRPKLCSLCGSIHDRVVGPRCRRCNLEYAPETDIPQTFANPRIVVFIPPPEEQQQAKQGGRSYKKDPAIAVGMVQLPGWRIIEVMAELVRVEHFDCCQQRIVTRRHLRNAKGGSVRLMCRKCDVKLQKKRHRHG